MFSRTIKIDVIAGYG